jgi:hypothetical protein
MSNRRNSNFGLSFFGMVGLVMTALKLKQNLDDCKSHYSWISEVRLTDEGQIPRYPQKMKAESFLILRLTVTMTLKMDRESASWIQNCQHRQEGSRGNVPLVACAAV